MKTSWTVGSDPNNDICIADRCVSPRHCELALTVQGWALRDLGSASGTFVNGVRITRPVRLAYNALVTLGPDLRLPWPRQPAFAQSPATTSPPPSKPSTTNSASARPTTGAIAIEARDITVDVPHRRLLESVSLTILPGELAAIMGPSGAGKSTLIGALNGYTPPTSGQVLINGVDLYANYDMFRQLIGYVPQDDIMHRELTVGQALYYTAKLRLPAGTTDDEISRRIDRVLEQLELTATRHTLIGTAEKKGLSGGQRKRVNLAMELLTDPAMLMLDEPTSGLSSEDALRVMMLLRQLAAAGKTILITIHQPSLAAYRLLDRLIVVAKDADSDQPGRLVYFGPAYPDPMIFFNPERARSGQLGAEPLPDEILRGLANHPVADWSGRFQQSAGYQTYVAARSLAPKPPPPLASSRHSTSVVDQWLTLTRRALAIKLADRWNTAILLAQAPIVAVLVVLVFGQQARAELNAENWTSVVSATAVTLFLVGLAALWFGCSNSVREIVGEWAVYHRERMVNVTLPAYLSAKLTVSAALCLLQCLVLLIATHFGCGLSGPLVTTLLVLMLVATTGIGIGLLLSAAARTSEAAIALLPVVLIPMVIFGGTMLPIHKMPKFVQPIAQLMPTRYGFEALVESEALHRPLGPSPYSATISTRRGADDLDRPDLAENYFPRKRRLGPTVDVSVLASMIVGLLAGIVLVLRYRDIH